MSRPIPCDLNTTECILITLSQVLALLEAENDQYNWNPLTFWSTLAIGVMALFFTTMAIMQACLSAGPGRLKYGREAIGPWSKFSRRKFDWSELRYRQTVKTPIISFPDDMYEWEGDSGRNQTFMEDTWEGLQSSEGDDHSPLRRPWDRIKKHTSPKTLWKSTKAFIESAVIGMPPLHKDIDHDYFPASWLALLTSVGADDPSLWRLKMTGTDYVPSDITAAIAYGNIISVTILALLATKGRASIQWDEANLPWVNDEEFDLRFRFHSVLGLVGSFQKYVKIRLNNSPLAESEDKPYFVPSDSDFLSAHGAVIYRRPEPGGEDGQADCLQGVFPFIDVGRTDNVLADCGYKDFFARKNKSCACTNNKRYTALEQKTLCLSVPHKQKSEPFYEVNFVFLSFLVSRRHGILPFLDRLHISPYYFPFRLVGMDALLSHFLVQSRLWRRLVELGSESTTDDLNEIWGKAYGAPSLESSFELPAGVMAPVFRQSIKFVRQELPDSRVRWEETWGCSHQVEFIDGWIQDNNLTEIANCRSVTLAIVATLAEACSEDGKRSSASKNPAAKLVMKDAWRKLRDHPLLQQASTTPEERVQVLESIFHSPWTYSLETHHLDWIFDLLKSARSQFVLEEGQEGAVQGEIPLSHPLDDLLIYRMVLCVRGLAMAGETSDLFGNKHHQFNQIIPLI